MLKVNHKLHILLLMNIGQIYQVLFEITTYSILYPVRDLVVVNHSYVPWVYTQRVGKYLGYLPYIW